MNKELIIRSSSNNIDFALLKEGKLVELHKEKHDNNYSVGDIYLGKVKKIVPGLNASFVNVGASLVMFTYLQPIFILSGNFIGLCFGIFPSNLLLVVYKIHNQF